jgi:hypothetical protein
MPQGHLRGIKVEKVHQFDCLAFSQSGKVDPLRLVVELELDREDLNVFWINQNQRSP